MKSSKQMTLAFGLLAVSIFGLSPLLKADVVVLQSGAVITGKVLQQDAIGVLFQTESGTYRYPLAWIQEVKKEPVAVPHISNNGQVIPDWAQIVSLLANNNWAPGLKQVPAAMIEAGDFKNVPYVSFRCANGLYEVNIFGDLDHPAAVQIGAMNYLHQTSEEKSNCVNFVCSVLASVTDRRMVRALNLTQKDLRANGTMVFETILPGEWGSYGGWWVSVCDTNALANAQASQTELLAITQTRTLTATNAVAPSATATATATAQPTAANTGSGEITSSGTYSLASGWTPAEMADAHPATTTATPSSTADKVYPRTYTRTGGTYAGHR